MRELDATAQHATRCWSRVINLASLVQHLLLLLHPFPLKTLLSRAPRCWEPTRQSPTPIERPARACILRVLSAPYPPASVATEVMF